MSKQNIQWLYSELPKLVREGVLSDEASEKLRQHYAAAKSKGRRWLAIVIFGTIGALLIGLGVILLFGHNWELLSRPARAILSLLPLIGAQLLGGWVLLKRMDSVAWKEAIATLITMMIGASIALIDQTYHLSRSTDLFLFSWSLLAIPLAYLLQSSMPALLYIIGIISWASAKNYTDYLQASLFWPMIAIVIPHFMQALKQEEYAIRAKILSWAIAISLLMATGRLIVSHSPGFWYVVYGSILSIYYFIGTLPLVGVKTDWRQPFRRLGEVGIFIVSFILTFKFAWEGMAHPGKWYIYDLPQPAYIINNVLILAVTGAALLFTMNAVRKKATENLFFGIFPLLVSMAYILHLYRQPMIFIIISFNLYLLVLSIRMMGAGIRDTNLGDLNKGMVMLTALIAARFFDLQMSFIIRGLVFIAIGIGFLSTNLVLLRRRGGER